MRVVIVSDRPLVLSALASLVQQVPGAQIVAAVRHIDDARIFCASGGAEAVMIDAFIATRDLPVRNHENCDSLMAAVARSPWLRPDFRDIIGKIIVLQEEKAASVRDLTPRELEIFVLLGAGLSNHHISRISGISERTVKSHVGNILAKLNMESRLQAGLAALVLCLRMAARKP